MSKPCIADSSKQVAAMRLGEPSESYATNFTGENEAVSSKNTLLRDESVENASTKPGPTRHDIGSLTTRPCWFLEQLLWSNSWGRTSAMYWFVTVWVRKRRGLRA